MVCYNKEWGVGCMGVWGEGCGVWGGIGGGGWVLTASGFGMVFSIPIHFSQMPDVFFSQSFAVPTKKL